MGNGNTDTTEGRLKEAGSGLSDLGQAIETLFGPAPAAPSYTPARSTAGPMMGGPASTQGAGQPGLLPPTPSGSMNAPPPPPGAMQTGVEFSTPDAAKAATVAGGMSNIFGAISQMANQKKQDEIQHAQFLYQMVKTAYENGDQQTANTILGDPKNSKKIEKYLTGNLPRVPNIAPVTVPGPLSKGVQGTESSPVATVGPGQKPGGINQPGGFAMPRPGVDQQLAAARSAMLLKGLQQGDPRAVGQVMGPEATLSPDEYKQGVRQQFGIDLTPAQVATMDQNTRTALIQAKSDVLKYVVGKQATLDTALQVAKIHAGAQDRATNARVEIAKNYRQFLLKVKGAAPDKIEQLTYTGLMSLYTKMATDSETQSATLLKGSPSATQRKMSDQFHQEAQDYAAKAEGMKSQYEAGQFLDKLLSSGGDGTGTDKDDSSNTSDEDKLLNDDADSSK